MKENFLPKPPPKNFWEDDAWAIKHYQEIVQKHPECWVAIVDKKVVATGKTWAEARNLALEKTDRDEFPIYYTEAKRYIYSNDQN